MLPQVSSIIFRQTLEDTYDLVCFQFATREELHIIRPHKPLSIGIRKIFKCQLELATFPIQNFHFNCMFTTFRMAAFMSWK